MERPTRSETLLMLRCMGADIPVNTKLSDEVLEKRLRDALNASQQKDRLAPLDLTSLPKWQTVRPEEKDYDKHALFRAVQKSNMDEVQKRVEGRDGSRAPGSIDPFLEMRQTIAFIARMCDEGGSWCVVQDEDDKNEDNTIGIRVVSVLKVNEKTPALVVLYRAFNPSTARENAMWVFDQSKLNASVHGKGFVHLRSSAIEMKLLLKLLRGNTHLVPANFKIDKQASEAQFKPSVLLPVGPLDFDALSKLSHNPGCSVCGKKAASRCSQCQSVSYCGPACQRADWPEHKHSCKSLKGGRWVTITFQPQFPLPQIPGVDMSKVSFMSNLNKFSSDLNSSGTREVKDSGAPPPNVWGDRVFMIKLQIGMGSQDPRHMMIYDRKRSFQGFMLRENNPCFADFYAEMLGPRGGFDGLKMYRWAKRTGDWELSVCLDRQPQTDTKW
ncbi:hypothetical protein GY45DRAFT_1324470 [Cubamyces sp. BRFM 1775]|nr:hypothetical protein GY45DRAFT_1324470 [Cubamyces sp. BRFM 1775]